MEQIYYKNNKKYIPTTPIDGWSDDIVMTEPGIYLVDVDTTKTMKECVLKPYSIDSLKQSFNSRNEQITTREELTEIIRSYVVEGIEEDIRGQKYKTIVLEEDVDKIVDVFLKCFNRTSDEVVESVW